MANRYALVPIHYHNTVSGKDEHVPMGALRDSTHQSVVQCGGSFSAAPLQAGANVTGVLAQYLLLYPSGP